MQAEFIGLGERQARSDNIIKKNDFRAPHCIALARPWLIHEVARIVLAKLKALARIAYGIASDKRAIARAQRAARSLTKRARDDGGVGVVFAREVV